VGARPPVTGLASSRPSRRTRRRRSARASARHPNPWRAPSLHVAARSSARERLCRLGKSHSTRSSCVPYFVAARAARPILTRRAEERTTQAGLMGAIRSRATVGLVSAGRPGWFRRCCCSGSRPTHSSVAEEPDPTPVRRRPGAPAVLLWGIPQNSSGGTNKFKVGTKR